MSITPLAFDETGARYYETGVSKGIFFPIDGSPGVPWNGLVSVSVDPSGGSLESSYFDGVKFMDKILAEEFQATVQTMSTPKEFESCEGVKQIGFGLKTYFNKRDKFHMVWRTEIGSDAGVSVGYKLHIAYNCRVQPSARNYQTLSDTTGMDVRSFVITSTPACGRDSYYTFDSRDGDLTALEALLYVGTLPKCWELKGLATPYEGGDVNAFATDQGCPSLLTDLEMYSPGQLFNDVTYEEYWGTDTLTFLHGLVNNGLDVVELPATGAFAANDSAASKVGTGNVLADDDDATYITSADGDLGYTIGLPSLVGYVTGSRFELHIRMSITGGVDPADPDNLDADAQVHISTDAAGDLTIGGFSDGSNEGMGFALSAVDGTIVDYVIPLSMDAWVTSTLEDVVTALNTGAYLNVVSVYNNNPETTPAVARVYEASIVMLNDTSPEKFLRSPTMTGEWCFIEHHLFDPGTTVDLLADSISYRVDFKAHRIDPDAFSPPYLQQPIAWDGIGGGLNPPALAQLEYQGDNLVLRFYSTENTMAAFNAYDTGVSYEDQTVIPEETWFTVQFDWDIYKVRYRLWLTETGSLDTPIKDLTRAVDSSTYDSPIGYVHYYGGNQNDGVNAHDIYLDNAMTQVHCNEVPTPYEGPAASVEYPVALIHTNAFSSLGRTSVFSDPDFPEVSGSVWSFSSNHAGMTFDFDQVTSQAIYDLLSTVDIVGWKIKMHVSTMVGTGPYKVYYNFAFDKPGEAQLPYDGIPGYTAYGPEDLSTGSYIDIDGPGDYSLVMGVPYSGSYANTPERVLDRMRNDITDAYGRVSGDAGFTGAYNHGYGRFEAADTNPDGGVITISQLKVVFYT